MKKSQRHHGATLGKRAGLTLATAATALLPVQAAIYWPSADPTQDPQTDYESGWNDGQEACRTTPLTCGVQLADMIRNLGYGETEPNDHIFNADGLVPGRFYHANSLAPQDEDWYYFIADERNQKLTVYFLGDSGNYTNTGGWLIQVRDLKGNLLAAFDSNSPGAVATPDTGVDTGTDTGVDTAAEPLPPDTPVEDNPPDPTASPVTQARVTEVTLGAPGTYYVTVQPKESTLIGYHIGIALAQTGQYTELPTDNRFDTETEPNNDSRHADPIRSQVVMKGTFDRTLIKYQQETTPAETTYTYLYKNCTPLKVNNPEDTTWFGFNGHSCTCDIKNYPVDPPNPSIDTDPDQDGIQPGNLTPAEACYAKESYTPPKTEWRGIFEYDTDVYVYTSPGSEQLRIQICTRTDCDFTQVHLRIYRNSTNQVLLEGPIQPGQVFDLGADVAGDYYLELTPEEIGVDGETGEPQVEDLRGPYDILVMGTRFKPGGTIESSAKEPPVAPEPPPPPPPPPPEEPPLDPKDLLDQFGLGFYQMLKSLLPRYWN